MAIQFFVSTNGHDNWTGRNAEAANPNPNGPFATIGRAQQAVRELKNKEDIKSDIEVFIRGGKYELSEPLCFTTEDSGNGKYKVTYKSYKDEIPVISGGRVLSCNWQKSAGNLWKTDVSKGLWFRDLYSYGKRMRRARYPKKDNTGVIWNLTTKNGRAIVILDGWTWRTQNVCDENAEMVLLNVWSMCRSRILSSEVHTFELENTPGWVGHDECTPKPGYRAFLEHSLDFVDESGQWFLDASNSCLYFMAPEGKDPNNMEFVVPVLDKLLILKGTKENPINNIHFEGISFENSKWDIPSFGYSGVQAGHHGTKFRTEPTYGLPAAVHLEYSCNCTFYNCRFAHTGAGGIAISAGCHGNSVMHSEICDIGGNGVFVGWREKSNKGRNKNFEHDWDDVSDAPTGNQVINNKIHDCGVVQFDTVGVCAAYSPDTKISHNDIYDLPYTGISIGYIWGTEKTSHRNCEVSYNHIYDIMKTMYDGGGIYTLGNQPGTRIVNNLIHDVPNGHGLYTDQGSSHIELSNNIVYNVGILAYQHHFGVDVTLRNNIFYGNKSTAVSCPCREDVESQVVMENNIICLDSGEFFGGGWPWKQITLRDNVYWDNRWPIVTETKKFVEYLKIKGIDPQASFADPEIQFNGLKTVLSSSSKALSMGFSDNFFSEIGPDWI